MRHASPPGAIQGLLVLAAAVETILLASLALTIGNVGRGSDVAGALARCNAALLRPLNLSPALALTAPAAVQQVVATLGYAVAFLTLIGVVSWFERRRLVY
jgi:hypothetical protein